jgi:hypothetical protein
VVGPKT